MNRASAHLRPRSPGRPIHAPARAFTLAELIIAGIMLAILVTASCIAISQTLRARDRSQSRADAFSRASSTADLIAADAANALRDADLTDCRIAIVRDGKPGLGQDGLLLFSHLNRIVRPNSQQAEGDEAEVQFRLQSGDKPGSLTLWRRTDPVIDEVPDGGGVASALIDGIKGVRIQASNGADWLDEWDSDNDGLPYAVRISVTGTDDAMKEAIVVRRVVAIDRVPLPSEKEAMADATSAAAVAAASNAQNNPTNTNTNPNTNANTNRNPVGGGGNTLQGRPNGNRGGPNGPVPNNRGGGGNGPGPGGGPNGGRPRGGGGPNGAGRGPTGVVPSGGAGSAPRAGGGGR